MLFKMRCGSLWTEGVKVLCGIFAKKGKDVFFQGTLCTAVYAAAVGKTFVGKVCDGVALAVDVIACQQFLVLCRQGGKGGFDALHLEGVCGKDVFQMFNVGKIVYHFVISRGAARRNGHKARA